MRGLDHARHARHAADQNQFVDLVGAETSILQAGFDRTDRALEQIIAKLLHLGAGQLQADVLRSARVRRDERQIDVVLLRAGKRDLRFFRFFLDALQGVRLLAQIHALLFFEFVENPIHDRDYPNRRRPGACRRWSL